MSFFLLKKISLILWNIRPETPPNTPQRVQIYAQQTEHDQHVLDSPEHHCLPNPSGNNLPSHRFNLLNIPGPPSALPNNNNTDPFAAPGQAAIYNGQTYNNLSPHLAAHLAAMLMMPAQATVYNGQSYNLPPDLAAHVAAMPAQH